MTGMAHTQIGVSEDRDDEYGDWLDAFRRATAGLRSVLMDRATTRDRAVETGSRGEGGDRTLVIDEAAEEVVFGELDKLHAAGRCFTAVSEERGEVDYGCGPPRVRALGSIAVSLCQVAAARLDGMVTLKNCRAVDAAAGQLIVREAGGAVAFTSYEDPLGAPLDVVPRSPVIAARTERALSELRALP